MSSIRSDSKRVAIVIANPAVSSITGWPVGFWWSELTHSYYVFTERGYEVEIFSPNGGKCEADAMSDSPDPTGYSSSDLVSLGFLTTPNWPPVVETPEKPPKLRPDFDALMVAGGQARCLPLGKPLTCTPSSSSFTKLESSLARSATGWPSSVTQGCRTESSSPKAKRSRASRT